MFGAAGLGRYGRAMLDVAATKIQPGEPLAPLSRGVISACLGGAATKIQPGEPLAPLSRGVISACLGSVIGGPSGPC
jgi:hypothetical protein